MEYFDLWDSYMIKSLRLPKSGNQLRFFIQRVPSGRTSNALSIPHRFSALMFSSLIASVWASRIYDGSKDGNPPPTPPPTTPQTTPQQAPHTVSTIKLPILKKGEYDIWAMKMDHYLAHIDYPIWEVIQKGNGPVSVTTDTDGVIRVLSPRTAEETLARGRERKARTTLLMALPEDHLAKFHKMTDAKDMWDAIKS
ncbi:hypothetical protein Tco_0971996 [Tanacetum coccineum]